MLSDSDMEDERDDNEPTPRSGLNLTTTTSRASEPPRAPSPPSSSRRSFENREDGSTNDEESEAEPEHHHETIPESASEEVKENEEEHPTPSVAAMPLVRPADIDDGIPIGPRKTRIIIRDAALRTWMAILFYVGTFLYPTLTLDIHRHDHFRTPVIFIHHICVQSSRAWTNRVDRFIPYCNG